MIRSASSTFSREASPWESFAASAVKRRLALLSRGHLVVVDGDEITSFGPADAGLSARVRVKSPAFWPALALRGSVGAGESYSRGEWEADDLTQLIRIVIREQELLRGLDSGLARLTAPLLRAAHALRRNTRGGSQRNISAHYDLGNDFFELILDETMTYSCGIFPHAAATLQEASVAKLDRICRKLELSPRDHVLEIGTGWGSFALHAASRYGCRVTTTTISERQHELAVERVRRAGLADRITLLREDYRDLHGTYDKVVSIEMIEAVGAKFLDDYFAVVAARLASDGQALIQGITIVDQHYEAHSRTVDFIKQHIFPGTNIPSVTACVSSATRASDLRLFHLEDIGPHYAPTLAAWRERMLENQSRIRSLGYQDELIRAWDFYFSYCEAGFRERYLGDAQFLFVKPGCRRESWLPALDAGRPVALRA